MTRKIHSLGAALAFLGGALLVWSAPAHAGPWVKEAGDGYLKLGLSQYEADESFNFGVATGLSYTGTLANLYAEFGLPGDTQLVADVPFVWGVNTSPQGVLYEQRSLGDGRFELDWAPLKALAPADSELRGLPLALGVEVKVPLYANLADRDDVGAWDDSIEKFPNAGDGNVDVTPKLLAGLSFHPFPGWATAELGYRARFGGFVDGLWLAGGAGVFVWPDWIALGVYGNALVNFTEDADLHVRASREFAYAQGYILLQSPYAPGLGLNAGFGRLVWSRNASAGQDLSLGVSYGF